MCCYIFKIRVTNLIVLSTLLLFLYSFNSQSQVFWTEDFTNGCPNNCAAASYSGVNGAWSVFNTGTNGVDNNPWYVSGAENGNAAGACATLNGTNSTLHIGSNATVLGDMGATFLNTGAGLFDIPTDLRAESPIINCTGKSTIILSFNYIENGDGLNDNATLWYTDGTLFTWIQLADLTKTVLCSPTVGTWTNYSQILPASADNNAQVQIALRWVNNDDATGEDPSIAIDDITLSTPVIDSVITGVITGSPFCACDTVDVPFTSIGTYTSANIYTAQLSDSSGSFAAPVVIGTLTDSTNSGTIECMIPCGTLTGSGYLIRVVSSAPAVTGFDNGVNITINSVVVPSVSITTTATNALCISTAVTFTATPLNGGTLPVYQWQRNSINVGADSPVYTSSGAFMNGETISVILTSNAVCATPTAQQTNTVIACPAIEIPNVFTPNGDGINDVFKINLSGESLTNFNVNIYDRWGILVFASTSINNKWDGRTTSGLKVESGTYFYVLDLNSVEYKGHVTVLE